MSSIKNVWLAGLLILPIVFWPWATVPYEIPRVWFVMGWVELLSLLGVLAAITKHNAKKSIDHVLVGAVITYGVISVVSSLLGADPYKSMIGNYYREDGLVSEFHLIGLFLICTLYWQHSWLKKSIVALEIGATAVSGWAIIVWMATYHETGVSFGQSRFLSGYLLVTISILVSVLSKQPRTWIKRAAVFSIFLQSIAILQTGSRAGVFGIVILFLWFLSRRVRYRKLFFLGCLFTVIYAILYWFIVHRQMYLPYGLRPDFLPEGRERIIRSLFRAVAARPLLGWGVANVDHAFAFNPWPTRFVPDVYIDKAHGLLLETLVTTGVAGLLAMVMIIGRALWKFRNTVFLFPFLVLIIHMQTNITSIAEDVLFWIFLGIALPLDKNK